MKKALVLLLTMPVLAFGTLNPGNIFDDYIGQYEVANKPIIKNDHANSCNRYFFQDLTGVEISKQSSRAKQSHVIKFHFDANGMKGWIGHPIEDHHTVNDELKDFGVQTTTSARSRTVVNGVHNVRSHHTYGTYNDKVEQHSVRIEKSGGGFVFKMHESLVQAGRSHSCSYRVKLRAQ